MRTPLFLLTAAATAVALAGCTAAAPNQEGGQAAQGGTTAPSGASDRQAERPVPPLEQFLAEVGGYGMSPEVFEEQREQQHAEIQDLIAACMSEAGFEYAPYPYVPQPASHRTTLDGITDDQDDPEWVSQYGYGIVHTPERPMDQSPEEYEAARAASYRDNAPDLSGLSPAQQQAYRDALHSEGGCAQEAEMAVRGPDFALDPAYASFYDAVTAFYDGWPDWEGIDELKAAWAACMTANDQPGLTEQAAATQRIATEYRDLWVEANPGYEDSRILGVPAGQEPDPSARFEIDLSAPPMSALEELAERERVLALADLACREEIDYNATMDAIQFRAETQFLEDHRAAADALRAAAEQAGRG